MFSFMTVFTEIDYYYHIVDISKGLKYHETIIPIILKLPNPLRCVDIRRKQIR